MTDNILEGVWGHVAPSLEEHFGSKAYGSWLKFLSYAEESGGRLCLSVPSRFLRDWISTKYGEQLLQILRHAYPDVQSIDFVVVEQEAAQSFVGSEPSKNDVSERTTRPQTQSTAVPSEKARLIEGTDGLDPRYTFDTFVVGKPNELAYAAAQRVANATSVYFNPLFLYGGVGLGKTHLMHALAWEIHKNHPNRKVIYMSAEQFMYRFVSALRHKDIMAFREQFRNVDVLMIDDVQFISGKDSTQEEFFHTFNALVDNKRQIILSADKSPSDLEGIQERVRSRLGWGLVADIHPTSYELRLGILESKVESMGVDVPDSVLEFLAHKITSNIRELEGALNRIVAHATLVGKKITMETTQHVLQDLLRANTRLLTVDDIQKTVAEHYNVRVSDMHSNRRLRVVARPRQVAMYLSKRLTQKSLPEIGRKFGGRDHTTVMHAVRKVESLMQEDAVFHEDVIMLENILSK